MGTVGEKKRAPEAVGPAQVAAVAKRRALPWWRRLLRDRFVLLFAIPGMAIIIAFQYYALLGNVIAFQDYQPYLGIEESLWVGLENFQILIDGDPKFLNALRNTLVITALQTIFVFPAPIVLALVLNSLVSNRIKQTVQSILYLPHFLSWVIVVSIFQQMLGGAGLLNNYLRNAGLDAINIIGNADAFYALITSQIIWKDTGWATILFLAVLAQIDKSLYEAASVDGASRWRQMWHVTLPGMRPIIILLFILKLGDSLTVGFEQLILQQQSVGLGVSEVLDTYVYNNGILAGEWGPSAAVGLVKGLVGLLLVLG
ncbi:MAG TPA: ABC transporter permease subunit, partial [Propionibacteriaceae bacterium]|nr:ABC transporter permease subunit [Propionibacteriaceae bacterium]